MSYQELKMIMRAKSSLAKGLVNLLKDDTERIYIDADDFDIFSLSEDVREAKRTAQHLIDTLTDIERSIRVAKRDA